MEAPAGVAVLTAGYSVHPEQGERRNVVVERQVARPCSGGVARLAFAAQLPGVQIALGMAADAALGEGFAAENAMVAAGAIKRCVGTDESEIGVSLVTEQTPGPAPRRVTRLAARAEAAIVIVLCGVTREAALVERRLLGARAPSQVAVVAAGASMLANQRELGIPIVIEGSLLPARRGMAIAARRSQLTTMHVLGGVAGRAVHWRLAVAIAWMAKTAIGLCMGSRERELGGGVVECGLAPRGGHVAIRAGIAEARPVSIVLRMAGHAITLRLAIGVACRMTGVAGDPPM